MEREHLLGALEYTERLLSLGEKTVLDIQADSIACFLESDFVGREGVSLNTDDGDVWLRMKRLAARIPIIPLASYRSGRKFPLPCPEIGYEALILFVPWCPYGGSDVCFRMNDDRIRPTARTL